MRGKDEFDMDEVDNLRITPAYAGKSQREHLKMLEKLGSPPPMRGKVHAVIRQFSDIRITPAYAGKSSCKL